ncbi:MAG: LLM class flavin-dependent oxidoreductase [Acidimicrobiales bacterium]
MKVRIGYGLGTRSESNEPERFDVLVDALESHRFDSLWLSERIGSACPDPVVGMSYAVGRTKRLKVGMSVMVLPGRNPVVLAKTMASLERMSGGRLLPAFGLGVADSGEHQAFGVERRDRGGWFNEALPLMRRLWSEPSVDHDGKRFQLRDVRVEPKPSSPLEVWLGGISPLELRRVGRHGDGWLPSFVTPAQVAEARVEIERVADEHDREIDPEHYGALIPYRLDERPLNDRFQAILDARNPGVAVDDLVPTKAGLPAAVQRFVDVGFSKFVLIPTNEPDEWAPEIEELAAIVKPLEN